MTSRNCSGVSFVAGYGGADAGVVHQDVDAPELAHAGVHQRAAVLGLGDVRAHGDHAATERLDGLARVLQLLGAPGAEHDVGARLGERGGEDRPQPGGGAGDHGDAVVESEAIEDAHGHRTVGHAHPLALLGSAA